MSAAHSSYKGVNTSLDLYRDGLDCDELYAENGDPVYLKCARENYAAASKALVQTGTDVYFALAAGKSFYKQYQAMKNIVPIKPRYRVVCD